MDLDGLHTEPSLPLSLQLRLAQQAADKRGGVGSAIKFQHLIHVIRNDMKKKQRVKVRGTWFWLSKTSS